MAFQPPPGSKPGATIHPLSAQRTTGNWLSLCHASKTGGPLPTLHNALLALRLDPHWSDAFLYDEMLRSAMIQGARITDHLVFGVHEWMQTNGLRRMGIDPVREAVEIVAREHPVHRVRSWLDGLTWDVTPRTPDWLSLGLGAEDNEYHKAVGAYFLVAMVARIYQPGCKADYMLVLEGNQGILKSQAAAILAGPEYFSDSMPDLGSDHVRVSMHLRGKWIVEVSELASFSRADAARLKAFLTSQTEQYTPKFGRNEVQEPRQCVFIGTTNKDTYLLDDTGGRRFWPVRCGAIDLDWLRDNREQLLAEAVHQFKAGAQWWPDRKFEQDYIAPVQAERYEADAWDETVLAYLVGRKRTTLLEVAQQALSFEKHAFRRSEQLRVAAVLRTAGWRDRKGTGGARFWELP